MESWMDMLQEVFEKTGDNFDNIICTLTKNELNVKFDTGYGSPEGKAFTAWSDNYVYFPVCYDGAEWVGFTHRNPNGKATEHQGSW